MHAHYHMKQVEIARRLGITQAAVSKYLSSRPANGDRQYDEVAAFIEASLKGDETPREADTLQGLPVEQEV